MNPDEFRHFADCFQEAEDCLKECEYQTGDLYIPSVNELRYAGYHALKAISATDPRERAEMIARGIRHCQRAQYDVTETSLEYHLELISLFQRDFSYSPVSKVVPQYTAYLATKKKAIAFLGQNSLRRHQSHKPDDYIRGRRSKNGRN